MLDLLLTNSTAVALMCAALVSLPPAVAVWRVTAPERRAQMIARVVRG